MNPLAHWNQYREWQALQHSLESHDYGSFVRTFSLPDDASLGKVSADFKEGVLKVHVAKDEKARPQQIEVNVS